MSPAPGLPGLTLRRELARKAIHLQSVAIPASYALGMPRILLLAALLVLVIAAIGVEVARWRSPQVRAWFVRAFAPLLREHEHAGLAGATWLVMAFFLAVLLLPRDIAIATTWAVAAGDASAAIVGRWVGRHRLTTSSKTLEGSLGCALVSCVGAWAVAGLPIGSSLVAAGLAALAEWPGRPLDDNVRMVAVVGGGILLWQLLFP